MSTSNAELSAAWKRGYTAAVHDSALSCVQPTADPYSDSLARPIERPGITVEKSLAQVLNLTPDSPAAIEWRERMADIARVIHESSLTAEPATPDLPAAERQS